MVNHAASYLADHPRLSISIITYYEVLRGLRYVNIEGQLSLFENFAADNEIIPLDLEAVRKAAEVYASLRKQGQLINEADILIAGTALSNNCALVTNNSTHFARITGLQIENWTI